MTQDTTSASTPATTPATASDTSRAALPPVRRQILVQAPAARCWEALTADLASWWPLARLGCTEDSQAGLEFVGGELVETGTDGSRFVWGEVLRWEPPHLITMTWHPGKRPDKASEVEWQLIAVDDQATLLQVVHRGWESYGDPAGARAEYGNGWPGVIAAFAERVNDEGEPDLWHILTHSAGPAADPAVPPQAQPGFAGHAAFLDQLAADGLLVAAGPLLETAGKGQTIVRGLTTEAATARATEVDESVRTGFFTVDIQPWQVISRG